MEKEIISAQSTDFALTGDAPETERMILQAVERNIEKAKVKTE